MAAEAGAGRDEADSAGTRVHKMKKYVDVKSGAYDREKLGPMNYADFQRSIEELVRNYLS